MKEHKNTELILKLIGMIFLIAGIVGVIQSINLGEFDKIFWFCYIALILLGIGTLRKDSNLISSQLNVLVIPAIIWMSDFFYFLFFGRPFLGISDYFFDENFSLISKLISMQHFFILPLGFYALHKIGLKRKDTWVISVFEMSLLFAISKLLTSPEKNMNCVFEPCMNIRISQNYEVWWFICVFLIIVITVFFVNWIFYGKDEK